LADVQIINPWAYMLSFSGYKLKFGNIGSAGAFSLVADKLESTHFQNSS